MHVVDEIIGMLESKGSEAYLGEQLSQLDRALQAGHLARESGADASLIAAAVLHDIGHLIRPVSPPALHEGDPRHDRIGAAWLACWFVPELTEPIRLHVGAKRYLCKVDPEYPLELSAASIQSLALQGRTFSWAEAAEFEKNPYHKDAIQLRRCDDKAKVPNLEVAGIYSYRETLFRCLKAH